MHGCNFYPTPMGATATANPWYPNPLKNILVLQLPQVGCRHGHLHCQSGSCDWLRVKMSPLSVSKCLSWWCWSVPRVTYLPLGHTINFCTTTSEMTRNEDEDSCDGKWVFLCRFATICCLIVILAYCHWVPCCRCRITKLTLRSRMWQNVTGRRIWWWHSFKGNLLRASAIFPLFRQYLPNVLRKCCTRFWRSSLHPLATIARHSDFYWHFRSEFSLNGESFDTCKT